MMTLDELVQLWVEARSNLTESERLEREAFHKMSKAFNDSGLSVDRSGTAKSTVMTDDKQDPSTWKVGDHFEVISNCDYPRHRFKIGTVVQLVELNHDSPHNIYLGDSGLNQAMNNQVLRKL